MTPSHVRTGAEKAGFTGSDRVAEICKNLPKATDGSAPDAPMGKPVGKGKVARKKGKVLKQKTMK